MVEVVAVFLAVTEQFVGKASKKVDMTNYYKEFAKNIYSQCGDDGVIEKMFQDLKIVSGTVLEVGANDPVRGSNIYNLWKDGWFNAILVEKDDFYLPKLRAIDKKFNNVELVELELSQENTLDDILKNSHFNTDPDGLAMVVIDVDSIDYHVFESIKDHSPKIVVVESNISYGKEKEITGPDGCSQLSLRKLGESKGYTHVFSNGNSFFVRNDLIHNIENHDFSYDNLYVDFNDVEGWYQTLDKNGKSKVYESNKDPKVKTKFYHLSSEQHSIANSEYEKCINSK